jgi:hypothetical protein
MVGEAYIKLGPDNGMQLMKLEVPSDPLELPVSIKKERQP